MKIQFKTPLPLSQAAGLICRGYLNTYQIALIYEIKDQELAFQKVDRINLQAKTKLLNKKLRLKGQQLSIHEVLVQAEIQSELSLILKQKDPKKYRQDYDIECSLGDLLDEVLLYFKNTNGLDLIYGCNTKSITFYTLNASNRKPLKVSLLDTQSSRAKPLIDHFDSIEPEENKPTFRDHAEQESLLQRDVDQICKTDIKPFIKSDHALTWLNELTRPHSTQTTFNAISQHLVFYFRDRRGSREYLQHIKSLDQYQVSKLSHREAVEKLERTWRKILSQYCAQLHTIPHPQKQMSVSSLVAIESGKDLDRRGLRNPSTQDKDKGISIYTALSLDIELGREKKWRWATGIDIERQDSLQDQEQLEFGAIQFRLRGNRLFGKYTISSFSPWANVAIEKDFFGVNENYNHTLMSAGIDLHGREKRSQLPGLQRTYNDLSLYLSYLSPSGIEAHDILGDDRDTWAFGLDQIFYWMKDLEQTSMGPYIGYQLEHRSSKSTYEDAQVYAFQLGFQWLSQKGLEVDLRYQPSWWEHRESSSEQLIQLNLAKDLPKLNSEITLKLYFNETRKGSVLENSRATGAQLSWGKTW